MSRNARGFTITHIYVFICLFIYLYSYTYTCVYIYIYHMRASAEILCNVIFELLGQNEYPLVQSRPLCSNVSKYLCFLLWQMFCSATVRLQIAQSRSDLSYTLETKLGVFHVLGALEYKNLPNPAARQPRVCFG